MIPLSCKCKLTTIPEGVEIEIPDAIVTEVLVRPGGGGNPGMVPSVVRVEFQGEVLGETLLRAFFFG